MCGCTHTVVRITAAVYEALSPILNEMSQRIDNGLDSIRDDLMKVNQNLTEEVHEALRPILNEMREDIISSVKSDIMVMKNEIATISQSVSNQTEEVNIRLSGLNDFNGVNRELNSTANMIWDKIEEHDNQITTELMRMNQTLTKEIINNRDGLKCGGTWGWRRAVYLDMRDPSTNFPSGWQLTGYSKRTCGRANSRRLSCDSVFFPVSGGPYSQVCGRIRAYQYGGPDAFVGYNDGGQTTIDSAYVSGVAVMYGSPRQHIWTFANGAMENLPSDSGSNCPCDPDPSGAAMVPPFVGGNYFCEAGYTFGSNEPSYTLHSNDTLWDGRDCHSTSTCCSLHNPPYFTKTLNQTTTDDLELRMCLWDSGNSDNIAVELVELYVK